MRRSAAADHLCATFGPPPKRTWSNGHAGLEYALCRLGRLVNEVEGTGAGDKYIQLADISWTTSTSWNRIPTISRTSRRSK